MSYRSSSLPNNVFEFENDEFFEFGRSFSGEKLAILLQFQEITDAQCFLDCEDPFEILSFDSDDLLDLKKKLCVKLNNNSFAILSGIKSKMKLLKNALIKKRNQLRKEPSKTSTDSVAINNTPSIILTAENLTCSSNSSTQSQINISSSSAVTLTINDEQKQHIIHLLDEWCEKIKEDNNEQHIKLKEGVDYELIVNYMPNKTLIKCRCGTNTTLGKKNNSYILSNYIRHLTKLNPYVMIQQKVKDASDNIVQNLLSINDNTNTSDNQIISAVSDSTPSSQTIS
ncbi:unnamed protein product [Rotaria sp. Silwood2]|nr:unnamed protein product [Rotaria sp. Silwood2]CAF2974801.1 unnamed protein product [Rotaria sp. Silwood2]CAF3050307.1 unnamed protein product [Rotaria sp. Silwood2]CAF3362552.1 unnamed protein product [Rotaria sp. Silwood2]CAF4063990.1 unnamed protein product [Rotaria sp. Silwood2]